MESTQGASTDNQSSSNNITTKQSTTPETTNILCQTKSVSTIHTANDNTSINTKQPAAMLHFKELENQLARERAQQQTDAIAAQQSFEKGPKMIPINVIPQQHQHYNSGGAAGREEDEDSLDDAKNYRLPIGIRKMNEKARKFYICVLCAQSSCVSSFVFCIYIFTTPLLLNLFYLIHAEWLCRCREVGKTTGINKIKSRTVKEYACRCETF